MSAIPDDMLRLQREATLALVQTGEELPWPERQPIPPSRSSAPSMPPDLLPVAFRDWIADDAERLGACVEFVAVPAVISAGSLLGRSLSIRPKARNNWTVISNLWGQSIARPAGMKTPTANSGLYHLRRLAAEEMDRYKRVRADAKARLDVLGAQRAALLRAAKKTNADTLADDVAALDRQIEEVRPVAARRRYIVNDCTVEALQNILSENRRGVFWYRDELTGLYGMMGRDGHENDRAFLLEAYEGGLSGAYESDRIARGNVRADGPCVSLFGTIQPGPIQRQVEGAVAGRGGADGWIQRFGMTVFPDEPGEGRGVDREPNVKARDLAFRAFRFLDEADRVRDLGAQQEDGAPDFLRFAPDAQGIFDDWLEEHHDAVRNAGDTPAFEEYLVKQRKTVPALALIFHALDVAVGAERPGPVSARAVDLATQWGAFLRLHAEKLFSLELRQAETAAAALGARLLRRAVPDGLTVSDLGERDWSGLGRPALVHAALDVLEPLGWIRRDYQITSGRTRTVVRIHPDFRTPAAAPEDPA